MMKLLVKDLTYFSSILPIILMLCGKLFPEPTDSYKISVQISSLYEQQLKYFCQTSLDFVLT